MNRIKFLIIVMVVLTVSLFSSVVDNYSISCSKGDSKSCYQLGISYRDGLGVEQNTVAAKQFFNIACDMGDSLACTEITIIDKSKNNSSIRTSKIKKYSKLVKYKDACNLGDFEKCFRFGLAYYEGNQVEQNYNIAKSYLEMACNNKVGVGCGTLGVMYENGKGVSQDYSKAKMYYEKGCDIGYSNGCLMTAVYYESGRGGKQNMAKAEKYYHILKVHYEKECSDNHANGCLMLGYMYSRGKTVEQNHEKAKIYYKKSCDFGNRIGCEQVAKLKE